MAAYFAPATTYAKANATATTQPTSAISELALDGLSLTPRDVIDVARYNKPVAPLPASLLTIKNSHTLLLEYAKLGRPVYGLNRGVGQNKDRTIFSGDTLSAEARKLSEAFNHRMLLSHTVAYGKPAATDIVRATMLIRLNTALYGGTGMSPELVNQYVLFLNKGLTPVIKSQGSIGAADITILPQIGLAMMGEGEVEFNGRIMPAAAAMQEANIQPAKPYAKDSLSLLSSNAYGAAVAILATEDATLLLDQADQVAALSLEGLNGNIAPLLSATQQHRPYKEQQLTAQRLLQLLQGSMSKVVVDDWGQCRKGLPYGALRAHVDSDRITQENLHAELGQIVAGLKPGRENDQETILFWHRGLSTTDISLGHAMLVKAQKMGLGQTLKFA